MPGFEVLGKEERQQIMEVLDTGVLFRYEFAEQRRGIYKVREFEQAFAAYTGAACAQAVTSGTAALKVALRALGIGPGDEVITQGFTFVATWEAILEVGAIPVFAEIDQTLAMDPGDLKKKITDRTACIIPVHMLGGAADIDRITAIGAEAGVPVLEDTAQAAGGRVGGRHLGTFGRCGTFSFDPVKTLTTGEGGMIITDDEELWRAMSEYHDHGHDHLPNAGGRGGEGRHFLGDNYRMMELQGAIGLAQLAKLDAMIESQRAHKSRLQEAAAVLPGVEFRKHPDAAGDSATFFAFILQDEEQQRRVNTVLCEQGVGAISFADNSWHFYPRWEHLLAGSSRVASGWPFAEPGGRKRVVYDPDALPASVELMKRTLVYPVSIKMPESRLAQIATALQMAADA
ncbi:DegT/DnrJ/EryC1/StrS family aminotransferase [Desulfofustis glycolicus]|uniref:dTDP-4-amino-4,6-dideoxygalactose transaminase n=1 Tax=Desulfofustis glycolicus DSM 9705 TaxID=1121409 RepID=A0A1M5WZ10_9BACT|nr:DegT/DnrJ/EryC1/StrS family aminotransferase [Desulfofustis glycolicus]MCB2214514.1 DegT/DnrJ/EryC1/StrS family aminotransferase [Desulfobulbaceae bacterium]SHH92143.1 dTDP-4-amino-4,6-dideoxygalactose transaminase [Desulfofustis glycolicus DSM 9705]